METAIGISGKLSSTLAKSSGYKCKFISAFLLCRICKINWLQSSLKATGVVSSGLMAATRLNAAQVDLNRSRIPKSLGFQA